MIGPRSNVLVTSADPSQPLADNRYDGYLAVDPSDPYHLIGICRHFYGAGDNYQDELEAQVSFDGGLSWRTSGPLPLQAGMYSISDPWVGVLPTGTPVVIGLPVLATDGSTAGSPIRAQSGLSGSAVNAYLSTDGGLTWQLNPVITYTGGYNNGDTCDNTFGAIDQNPNSPFYGRVYACWAHYYQGGTPTLAFAYSDDGVTWQQSSNSPNVAVDSATYFDLDQPWYYTDMAVGTDGHLHLVGVAPATVAGVPIVYATSSDGGNTFQFGTIASNQPTASVSSVFLGLVPTNTPPPTIDSRTPACIFAGSNGLVIAAWSVDVGNPNSATYQPLIRSCVAICNDNGAAWVASGAAGVAQGLTLPLLPLGPLPDTPNDHYFMPRLAGSPDGTVGCAFLHCQTVSGQSPPQLTSAQFSTCLAASRSYEKVSPGRFPHLETVPYFDPSSTSTIVASDQSLGVVSSNPVLRFGETNHYFIGDFIGLGASAHGFFLYWSDTRLGSGQLVVSRVAPYPCSTYIRHFASDNGTLGQPGPGETMFDAPDLIVRLQPDGDTTFVDEAIPANPPQDLYVYGRIFNNGPIPAINATLSAVLGSYLPGTEWFYPYDWLQQDWSSFGINLSTHTFLGTATAAAPIPVNGSTIVGPITITVANFPWGQGFHPCLLAAVHVDNDDGQGGFPFGAPYYATVGPGGMESFFWQSNKTCQKNLTRATGNPGQPFDFSFLLGNPLSKHSSFELVVEKSGFLADVPVVLRRSPAVSPRPDVTPGKRPANGVRRMPLPVVTEEWRFQRPTAAATVDRRGAPVVPMKLSLLVPQDVSPGAVGRIRIIQSTPHSVLAGAVDVEILVKKH